MMYEESSMGPMLTYPILEGRTQVQPDPSAFVADSDLIRNLELRSIEVACYTERLLFSQDDAAAGLYILLEGSATLSMHSFDGRPIFSVEALPGSLLGAPALISEQPYSLTAIAHAGAKVGFVARSDFFALMKDQPLLSMKILNVLAAEVRTARQALL
jgi:CRP-like cAMP-binding protein